MSNAGETVEQEVARLLGIRSSRRTTASDAVAVSNAVAAALRAREQEIERLTRQLSFLNSIGPEKDGWCGEHERRFAANAREDGDECQFCRADQAEAQLKAAQAEIERVVQNFSAYKINVHDRLAQAKREALEEITGCIETLAANVASTKEIALRIRALMEPKP